MNPETQHGLLVEDDDEAFDLESEHDLMEEDHLQDDEADDQL